MLRGSVVVLIVLLFLPLGLSSVESYSTWPSPIQTFVTYPEADYENGSTVDLTVWVFRDGDHYDPDNVSLTVEFSDKNIDLTRFDTGRYSGQLVIEYDDYFMTNDVSLWIRVEDGTDPVVTAGGGGWIDVRPDRSLYVDVVLQDVADKYIAPGELVTLEIRTTVGGEYVDIEPATMTAYARPDDGSGGSYLGVSKVSTGRYLVNFTAPDSHIQDVKAYWITADIRGNKTALKNIYSNGQRIYVQADLRTYCHVISINHTRCLVEIYVYDPYGQPMEGADIHLGGGLYWAQTLQERTVADAVTDADGRALIDLAYGSSLDPAGWLYLEGTVTNGPTVQFIKADLSTSTTDEYHSEADRDEGFDVIVATRPIFPGGASYTIPHYATYNDEPLANEEILYFIKNDHAIYGFGKVMTDETGYFELDFTTPEKPPDYARETVRYTYWNGEKWETTDLVFRWDTWTYAGYMLELFNPDLKVTFDPFYLNETVDLVIDHPLTDGIDELASLRWGVGNITDWYIPRDGVWGEWSARFDYMGMVACEWIGGEYRATIDLPSCVPEWEPVFFLAEIDFLDAPRVGEVKRLVPDILPLIPNRPPIVNTSLPVESVSRKVSFIINGSTTDEVRVLLVEVRIDEGQWMVADGTTEWEYRVKTGGLSMGNHTISVRAFDGELYSEPQTFNFTVKRPKDEGGGFLGLPGPSAIFAMGTIALTWLLVSYSRIGQRNLYRRP